MILVDAAVALFPVLVLLVVFRSMDGFRLVSGRTLMLAVVGGCAAAGLALAANTLLKDLVDPLTLRRYGAPVVEECLKASVVGALLWSKRAGFLIDAAILGFAVGTGFAVTENLFLLASSDLALSTWLIRGVGTAVMHGGATCIFAILAKRATREDASAVLPALALVPAIGVHSAYNHFILPPTLTAAIVAVVVPALVVAVFSRSQSTVRTWIHTGFDADQELIRLMDSGGLSKTPAGLYLRALRERVAPEELVDMICLIRLEAELSLRARGILMMRQAGFAPSAEPALRAKIREARRLERDIGKIGMLALEPILRLKGPDRWQRRLLEETPD